MNKKGLLILTLVSMINLTSCGGTIDYKKNLNLYIADNEHVPEYHDDFTILQLTDIHWTTSTQIGNENIGQIKYLTKLINEVKSHIKNHKIDLIEITGDTFMTANTGCVDLFIDFIESLKIPYAVTWGNHDREATYNPGWLSERFLNAPYSLYKEVANDNVHERSNYVINLKSNGKTKWQIINIDSGASYRYSAVDFKLTYDYIRDDQLDWLKMEHDLVGQDVPAIAYFHVPQLDFSLGYKDVFSKGGNPQNVSKHGFFTSNSSSFGQSKSAKTTKDIFLANNVVAAFAGHQHETDWTFTSSDGITYGMGVKTCNELYYATIEKGDETSLKYGIDEKFELIGASLVTLKNDEGDFTLEHLYLNERPNGDFVRWVVY